MNSPTVKKRIMLVDDHPMTRLGLAQLLNQQNDMTVCGQLSSTREALDRVVKTRPDLLITDLSLEGKSGLELIKDIQAVAPEIRILVLSMHHETLYAERALRAGARGYVMTSSDGDLILDAVRHVLDGRIFLSPKISDMILAHFSGSPRQSKRTAMQILSDREFEIFELIGEGCTTQEIARRLSISIKTVDVHRQHLKQKLKLPESTSLVQYAVRWVVTQERM